jgi:hypothetical protein
MALTEAIRTRLQAIAASAQTAAEALDGLDALDLDDGAPGASFPAWRGCAASSTT